MRHQSSLFFRGCGLAIAVWLTASTPASGQRVIQQLDTERDGQSSVAEPQTVRGILKRRLQNIPDVERAEYLTWQVDGIERRALVYLPEKTVASEGSVPVVFGFHGHGGSAVNAVRSFEFHKHWPEALVVYMQGIPTPGRLTDPEGKRNGWQHGVGDQGDQDLKFFDRVLAALKEKYQVDADRIYASGHSNGGGFTYLLWAERPDVFAAMAPSSAVSQAIRKLKRKPAMHIAARNDKLVRFAWQQQAMEAVRRINGCAETGSAWAKDCTLYSSSTGTPFVTFIHDGTHKFPAEAPPLIVKFFKEHRRDG